MVTDREAQLLREATKAGITSPKELANFMAQVTEESQGLTRLEESFRYTRSMAQIPVKYAHREGDDVLQQARLGALQGHPEKLAELMYGGRNGNDEPGDGYMYRGRGYIQLTGKANYQEAGNATGLDLVKRPDLAMEPANASRIAIWYWQNHVPPADRADVKGATLDINGGYNGLDARRQAYERWSNLLTPDVIKKLATDEMSLPIGSAIPTPRDKHATTGDRALSQGGHSVAIHALQTHLAQLGYTDTSGHRLKPDGDFGPNTRFAVEAFQHDHHLAVDGKVGPHTQAALDQVLKAQAQHAALLSDPNHPDHALFRQALAGVHRIDAQMGHSPDARSNNLAGALMVAAKAKGMSRIDEVAMQPDGARAFAAQNHAGYSTYADVATLVALDTPLEKSSAAARALPEPAPVKNLHVEASEQQCAIHSTTPGLH